MLSRVADSIYWMHRYVERAENVARVIDVNLHLLLDLPSGATERGPRWCIPWGITSPFRKTIGKPRKSTSWIFSRLIWTIPIPSLPACA